MKKTILCTSENGENGSKLKMFWRPKLFDILPDSAFGLGGVVLRWGSRQK